MAMRSIRTCRSASTLASRCIASGVAENTFGALWVGVSAVRNQPRSKAEDREFAGDPVARFADGQPQLPGDRNVGDPYVDIRPNRSRRHRG